MDTEPPSEGPQHASAGHDKIYSFDAHAGSVYEITVTDVNDFDTITSVLDCSQPGTPGQPATCTSSDTYTCTPGGRVEVRGVPVAFGWTPLLPLQH